MFVKLLFPLIVIFLIALWVRTVIDIVKNTDVSYRAGNQIVWLLLVILMPFIGVPLYWIIGAPDRR